MGGWVSPSTNLSSVENKVQSSEFFNLLADDKAYDVGILVVQRSIYRITDDISILYIFKAKV